MKTEIDGLIGLIDGKLSADEKRAVEELHQYMLGDEGSWALSDGFLDFVGKFFQLKAKTYQFSSEHLIIQFKKTYHLSTEHLISLGRLLHDPEFSLEVRIRILNILAAAALKDDVILVLHQDRKDHVLMNYAFEIDRLTPEEQCAIALFVSNFSYQD